MRREAIRRRANELFPRTMYTGTLSVFDEFSSLESGKGSGRAEIRGAVWVTDKPEVASWFALYPLRSPKTYLMALIRKANMVNEPYGDIKALGLKLVNDHPELQQAMARFEKTLIEHGISERSLIGKWLSEKGLRSKVLEDAEAIAKAFATITGTYYPITPSVIPLRINDRGFVAKDFDGRQIEEVSGKDDNIVDDLAQEAARTKAGGIVLENIIDGSGTPSTVMAVLDYARLRSAHAAFDPDLKDTPGLMN